MKIYKFEQQYLEIIDEKTEAIKNQKYENAAKLREKEKEIENLIKSERENLLKIYTEIEIDRNTIFELEIIANYFDPLHMHDFLKTRIKIEIEKTEKLKEKFTVEFKFQEANQQRERLDWLNKLLEE